MALALSPINIPRLPTPLVRHGKSIIGEAPALKADINRVPRPCSEAVDGGMVEDPTCVTPKSVETGNVENPIRKP